MWKEYLLGKFVPSPVFFCVSKPNVFISLQKNLPKISFEKGNLFFADQRWIKRLEYEALHVYSKHSFCVEMKSRFLDTVATKRNLQFIQCWFLPEDNNK